MSVTGLFSGIGGFELAFAKAGFHPGLLVEIDAKARVVLKANFPDVEIRQDVSNLRGLPASTTILTAGFPCQNLSMAGDKKGINGAKSNVVVKMFDLMRRRPPPIVVIENVYFMLQLDSGKGMEYLVHRFEDLGYWWAYRVLDTWGFGLPQRRRRVYLVASRDLDPRAVLFADESSHATSGKPDLTRPLGFYWTEGRSGVGFTIDGVPPLKAGSTIGIPSPPAVLFPDGQVLAPSLAACERLQGFAPDWTAAADDDGRRRPGWRMVGNAISVPVAEWVARRVRTPGTVLDFERVPLDHRRRWPDAAWNVGGGREAIMASDKPVLTTRPSIAKFRDKSWERLSDRALDGFIGRAVAGGLWMPKGFLTRLRGAPRKVKLRSARHGGARDT